MPIRRNSKSPRLDGRHQPSSPTLGVLRPDEPTVELRCSVLVRRDAEVLLVHRSRRPELREDGDWVLPGGRPRRGESLLACARRKAAEETGLDVVVRRCLFILEVNGPDHGGRLVELVFAAQALPGAEPVASQPHRHPCFVRLSDLQHLRLRPPLAGYLRGMPPGRLSGAAYVGNLWRQESGPGPRMGLA